MTARLITILIISSLFLPSCAISGDTAVMVKGRLLNSNSEPHTSCTIRGSQGKQRVYSADVEGDFERTIVFRPVSGKPLELEMSCANAIATHKYVIERIPRPFGKVLDVGSVVLE